MAEKELQDAYLPSGKVSSNVIIITHDYGSNDVRGADGWGSGMYLWLGPQVINTRRMRGEYHDNVSFVTQYEKN